MASRSALRLSFLVAVAVTGALRAQAPTTGLIAGQVVDAVTGRPVPHAVVTRAGTRRPQELVECDDKGQFVFGLVEPGAHDLWAEAPGYTAMSDADSRSHLNMTPGQRLGGVTLKISKTVTIGG